VAGTTEGIEYEDAAGKWHGEVAEGTDRPENEIVDEDDKKATDGRAGHRAAGMVGRKLVSRLAAGGVVAGRAVGRLILADVVAPEAPISPAMSTRCLRPLRTGRRRHAARHAAVADLPLAAVVSGEAEADFEKGYKVNLDGMRTLLEAIRGVGRQETYVPRLVFTSSIAVFGAPLPDVIGETECLAPLTSYGTQKAISELLLADYSRRGLVDGIGVRLPTIVIRPGKPNRAASGFFSGILREPLNGEEAVLPVDENVRHWFASPRAAVNFLMHAAALDTSKLGSRRSLTMPGLSATVGEEIEALRRAGGEKAVRLIRREPDETVARIVAGWPRNFDASRAEALGFVAEKSFDEIIAAYLEDERGAVAG